MQNKSIGRPISYLGGKTIGTIIVLAPALNEHEDYQRDKNNHLIWKCKCECGKLFSTTSDRLQRKKFPIKNCGGCNETGKL